MENLSGRSEERKLGGRIIWFSRAATQVSKANKQWIYSSPITGAVLTPTGLKFSAVCNPYSYDVKLARIKDTNFAGKMYGTADGEFYEYPLDLQVYENRLGLFLEGDWDEDSSDDGVYWAVVQLYYVND